MSWLSSIASIGGSLLSGRLNNSAASAQQSTAINANREFYQNRHQWEVEDLRKAGLNPILSANNASGSGIGATATATPYGDLGQAVTNAANTAIARKQLDIADKNASTNRILAENDRTKSAATMMDAQTRATEASHLNPMRDEQTNYYRSIAKSTEVRMELDRAMNAAQINAIDQKLIMARLELAGKLDLMEKQGNAALTQASVSSLMAEVARQNGVSLRQLQQSMIGKNNQEILESAARVDHTKLRDDVYRSENSLALDEYGANGNPTLRERLWGAAELIERFNPLKGFIK